MCGRRRQWPPAAACAASRCSGAIRPRGSMETIVSRACSALTSSLPWHSGVRRGSAQERPVSLSDPAGWRVCPRRLRAFAGGARAVRAMRRAAARTRCGRAGDWLGWYPRRLARRDPRLGITVDDRELHRKPSRSRSPDANRRSSHRGRGAPRS